MLVFLVLGNAKVLSFALGDAKVSNVNDFASQWNIGLKLKINTPIYIITSFIMHIEKNELLTVLRLILCLSEQTGTS